MKKKKKKSTKKKKHSPLEKSELTGKEFNDKYWGKAMWNLP